MTTDNIVTATTTTDGAVVGSALARALADELVALTGSLSELACDLGSDAGTLRRHMVSLQSIDRITQTQLAIAEILRSGKSAAACIDAVTLETLAGSLKANYTAQLEKAASVDASP